MSEHEVEELPPVDDDGKSDHGDTKPTKGEVEAGREQGLHIDPDDDESGSEAE